MTVPLVVCATAQGTPAPSDTAAASGNCATRTTWRRKLLADLTEAGGV